MAKEKNKPVPVRFNLKLLEVLKEEEKIDTPQQALNFLTSFWENNRPAKGGFFAGGGRYTAVGACCGDCACGCCRGSCGGSFQKENRSKKGRDFGGTAEGVVGDRSFDMEGGAEGEE